MLLQTSSWLLLFRLKGRIVIITFNIELNLTQRIEWFTSLTDYNFMDNGLIK